MIRQRGSSFQADVTIEGKRRRKQFTTYAAAAAWEASQSSTEGDPYVTPKETLSASSARLHAVLWDTSSEHSVDVKRHLDETVEILGDIPVETFDNKCVDKLLLHYRSKGLANATINRKFASLSKLFRHLHRSREIQYMPYFPRQKERLGRVRFLTEEEEDRLFYHLRQLKGDNHRLAVFLVDTGARMGEALKVQHRDVDLINRCVTFWETKSNHSRTVYLTDRAYDAVVASSDCASPFAAINRWTFKGHWDKAKEHAGLGDDTLVVPHILRHTCASRLVQGGMDLRRVQEWMGHRSMQMTMRYAHLAPQDLKRCVDVLERGRGGTVDAAGLKPASLDRSEGSNPSVRTKSQGSDLC